MTFVGSYNYVTEVLTNWKICLKIFKLNLFLMYVVAYVKEETFE